MQFQSIFDQKDPAQIEDLIRSQPSCKLITQGASGIQVGIYNPHYDGKTFQLHLNRRDEQIKDMKHSAEGLILFEEFLAVIPSYWVDEDYAGAATSYYRYAEFRCRAEVIDSTIELQKVLEKLMNRHQPEGGFAPMPENPRLYEMSLNALALVNLTPVEVRTKWKLGQNRPRETRFKVLEQFRKRGLPGDLRAAAELEISLNTS